MKQPPNPMTEEQIRAVTVGEPEVHGGPIELVDYDPRWPQLFAREAGRITAALGERAIIVEHVGSTAVPKLAAQPFRDIRPSTPPAFPMAAAANQKTAPTPTQPHSSVTSGNLELAPVCRTRRLR